MTLCINIYFQAETTEFVDKLFLALESKIYLNQEPGAKPETKPGRYEITINPKSVDSI